MKIRPEPHDPPDFWVTIDGDVFSVEVTSVVSDQQYLAHCVALARAINNRTANLGVLSGTYVITDSGTPHLPRLTSRRGQALLQNGVAYINNTNQQIESSEVLLFRDSGGEITVEKLSPKGSAVVFVGSPLMLWEGEVQDKLVSLLQQRVDDKKRKLAKAGIGPTRAILVLYDAFGHAEPQEAIAALEKVSGYNWFHSIFWAASFHDRPNVTYPSEPGRDGCFLFSTKTEWNRVGSVPPESDA